MEENHEILLNTLAEVPQEEVRTLEEDIYVIGVESLNGKAGDLTLKNINGEDLVGTGNIELATHSAFNELSATVATKQDQLTETQLAAVNSGIDSSKVQQIADNTSAIAGKQDQLTQTQLNAVNSGIDETKVAQIATNTGNITSNTNRITTIEGKIPSAATNTNQLTDKNYVDNAIATNTANYISDNGQPFQSLADLEAYSGPLTNNDYAFVVSTDSAGNLLYTRYKYNADQELWAEEYTIANPTFTSTQWAAIDSGVTANDVTQIGTNKSDIASLQSGKQDALSQTQLDAVNSGIDATKVQQITTNASNITSLQTDKQDKLIAGSNIQIASDGKTISATDTTYTAGTGLTLAGTQFSVTEPVPIGFFSDTAGTQEGTGTTITLNNTAPNAPIDMVELNGDTYQNGDPTPDSPSAIQTVTGSQTVTVTDGGTNSQSYNIDLGSIELCKIGTYQDYIWKDGSDWKLHKAIGKVVLDGTEGSWNRVQVSGVTRYFTVDATGALIVTDTSSLTPVVCDNFTSQTPSNIHLAIPDYGISLNTGTAKFRFRDKDYTETSDFKTWISLHNTTVYYALATATDTVITDASLISQLDALAGSTTYAPQTNYATSTPSPNLPVILTVDVFKNNYAGLLARLNKAGA